MTKAIIYVRSAPQNPAGLHRKEADCREYVSERDLVYAETLAQTVRPDEQLLALISTAAEVGATEIIVTDLTRLGRKPSVVRQNLGALDHAGLPSTSPTAPWPDRSATFARKIRPSFSPSKTHRAPKVKRLESAGSHLPETDRARPERHGFAAPVACCKPSSEALLHRCEDVEIAFGDALHVRRCASDQPELFVRGRFDAEAWLGDDG